MTAPRPLLPTTIDDQVAIELAAQVDLSIPPDCLPGVITNLQLLAEHAERLAQEAS